MHIINIIIVCIMRAFCGINTSAQQQLFKPEIVFSALSLSLSLSLSRRGYNQSRCESAFQTLLARYLPSTAWNKQFKNLTTDRIISNTNTIKYAYEPGAIPPAECFINPNN